MWLTLNSWVISTLTFIYCHIIFCSGSSSSFNIHTNPSRPFTELWKVSKEYFLDGYGLPTEDAYSSGDLVPSFLGLAYVLLVATNSFPELAVIYPDYAIRISLSNFSILHSTASECNIYLWNLHLIRVLYSETFPTLPSLFTLEHTLINCFYNIFHVLFLKAHHRYWSYMVM